VRRPQMYQIDAGLLTSQHRRENDPISVRGPIRLIRMQGRGSKLYSLATVHSASPQRVGLKGSVHYRAPIFREKRTDRAATPGRNCTNWPRPASYRTNCRRSWPEMKRSVFRLGWAPASRSRSTSGRFAADACPLVPETEEFPASPRCWSRGRAPSGTGNTCHARSSFRYHRSPKSRRRNSSFVANDAGRCHRRRLPKECWLYRQGI